MLAAEAGALGWRSGLRDPYSILGLAPDAGAEEIKAAYRRLAKRFHPDAQGNMGVHEPDAQRMSQRFQEVSRAYHLLKNAKTKAKPRTPKAEAKPAPAQASASREKAAPFEEATYSRPKRPSFQQKRPTDIENAHFSAFFDQTEAQFQRPFRARGEDRSYCLSISFVEAAIGTKKRIGLDGGRMLDVRLPAGVEDGQTIRLRHQGGEGFGGAAPGDALLVISVEPHEVFRRDGHNICLTLPISLSEAVLGATIEVDTISGPAPLTIPAGSNSGCLLTMEGKGLISPDGSAGDQHVTLTIMLPDGRDAALNRFVEGWEAGLAYDPRLEQTQSMSKNNS